MHLSFPCSVLLSESGGTGRSGQGQEAINRKPCEMFEGLKNPRTSNTPRHDFLGMPTVALLSSRCGGRTRAGSCVWSTPRSSLSIPRCRLVDHSVRPHGSAALHLRREDSPRGSHCQGSLGANWGKALLVAASERKTARFMGRIRVGGSGGRMPPTLPRTLAGDGLGF